MLKRVFYRLLSHLRYPISSPHDVLSALGVSEELQDVDFHHFLKKVVTRVPRRIFRCMGREDVERCFSSAYKKESFHRTTHASYYFMQGWLEFVLEFDESRLLRRLYVHHQLLSSSQSVELELPDQGGETNLLEICSTEPFKRKKRSFFDVFFRLA